MTSQKVDFKSDNIILERLIRDDPEALIKFINEIYTKVIKISEEICKSLKDREGKLSGNYDEV